MGSPEKCKTCGSDDPLVVMKMDLSTESGLRRCPDSFHNTPTPPAPADKIDPDEPIKCGTFGGVTIPPHIRARMDADRAAAKAHAAGAKCPRCGSSSPCVGPC